MQNLQLKKFDFKWTIREALWDIITKSVYTNEFDYIRELIQNAIDATLLKIYLDDKENIEYQSPRSWHCNDKVMIAYSQKKEHFGLKIMALV